MPSVLANVEANLSSTLLGITTANGYTNQVASVQFIQAEGQIAVNMPAIFVVMRDVRRDPNEPEAAHSWIAAYEVNARYFHNSTVDSRTTREINESWANDIIRALS